MKHNKGTYKYIFSLPYHHLSKRKISISLCYNDLNVSLFVIHDSEIIHKINKYKKYYYKNLIKIQIN